MFFGHRQKAAQDTRADGPSLLHHRLGPSAGVTANHPGAIQQIIQAALNDAAVWRV
jgi:hypothetical protein